MPYLDFPDRREMNICWHSTVSKTMYLLLVISTNKKGGLKMLPHQDRTWLVNHTQQNSENIDKLYKEFQIDYPNGGIYRRLVAYIKWYIVFTRHHSSLLQAVCRILPSRIGQDSFLSEWNLKRNIKSLVQVTLHFCDHIFRTLGKGLNLIFSNVIFTLDNDIKLYWVPLAVQTEEGDFFFWQKTILAICWHGGPKIGGKNTVFSH